MADRPIPKLKIIRYWIEGLLAWLLFTVFSNIPVDKASDIGGFLGRMIGKWMKVDRIARHNMLRAIPDLAGEEKERVVEKMWENLGRTIAEFPHLFLISSEDFNQRITVEGAEHLEILKQNGGIFFSGHMANWEILPRLADEHGIKMALIFRQANNPYVNKFMLKIRQGGSLEIFSKGAVGAKNMLRALKAKKVIGMLVDQKMNEGIEVPFFGMPAMTAPAVAKLALAFDCPIVPAFINRIGSVRFKVTILPPLTITKTGDAQEDTYQIMRQINELLEAAIREHPEQWFWVHQRWGKGLV